MPEANPALAKLGLSETDRVAIIHTDDIGMCQASVTAFNDLYRAGRITCGSIMVPCPWAGEAARVCREIETDLGHCDIGVHATLTSEWDTYRWRPISTTDRSSGLMDEDGFFHKTEFDVWEHADTEAAKAELETQVAVLEAAGLPLTHIDTHMGAPFGGHLFEGFAAVARAHRLVPFGLRLSSDQIVRTGRDEQTAMRLRRHLQDLEMIGVPFPDRLAAVDLGEHDPRQRMARTKALFDVIPEGSIAYNILHPGVDTPELHAICPDAPARILDYEIFMSDELADHIAESGVQLIGTKDLQAAMVA